MTQNRIKIDLKFD